MPRSRKRTSLTIDDPKALRALAHPARQRVINELFNGEVLTATEAARLCGITPSAMSYHLRALEKWGIVERGESSDGRERPWRATAEHFSVPASAHRAAGAALSRSFLVPWGAELEAGLGRAADELARGGAGELTTLSRSRVWLTAAEAKQLDRDLRALLQPYQARTSRSHPEGAVGRDGYWLLLPPR
jgi:DNA-binding transcriptional ArsR family regulator